MNDVLPKPFTKEGLLSMLEKHLGHLKRMADGMEPLGHTLPPNSIGNSLKDETSPADSPSTMSNWHSPGHFPGISPTQSAASQSYIPPLSAGAYSTDQSPMSFQPPHTPLGSAPSLQHRRGISEIGPDESSSDPKRQRYDQNMTMGHLQSSRAR